MHNTKNNYENMISYFRKYFYQFKEFKFIENDIKYTFIKQQDFSYKICIEEMGVYLFNC